jgi:hypothetical protein
MGRDARTWPEADHTTEQCNPELAETKSLRLRSIPLRLAVLVEQRTCRTWTLPDARGMPNPMLD